MDPISLEEACLGKCMKFFETLSKLNCFDVAHKYIYTNYPSGVLNKLIHKLHYYRSAKLTILLLPYLMSNGKINLTDQNLVETIYWLETHPELESKLASITNLKINISDGANYFKLHYLISKMPNLKIFTLNSCTTDELLAKIGMSCNKIEIFDSHDDTSSTVTDAGLAFISHCRNLKIIRFSNMADEYDYEDKFRFSSKGVAMLIFALPKLQRLECPEYLLRDALQFLYQINFKNITLPLSSICLNFPDIPGSTVEILSHICPNITTLSIFINEREETIIAKALKRLLCLQKLNLNMGHGGRNIKLLCLADYGHRLKYFKLQTPLLGESDLAHINQHCYKLEILSLKMVSSNHDCLTIDFNLMPKFNSLHSLEIYSRISMRMFVIVNTQAPYLKALYCTDADIESFPTGALTIIAQGSWSYLEVLVLPMLVSYRYDFLCSLLVSLKNLKILAICFSCISHEIKVKKFIAEHKLAVRICDHNDLTLPSRQFDPVEYSD